MVEMEMLAEQKIRGDLAGLLLAATGSSGRTRTDIGKAAGIHKDALRRMLDGKRSASMAEALRIMRASGASPHAHLILFLVAGGERSSDWLHTDIALFFEELFCELPTALERILGNQIHDIKPRWAKGTAQRLVRLLSDHIEELERKDALLGDIYAGSESRADA